jgi:hypothetical protein
MHLGREKDHLIPPPPNSTAWIRTLVYKAEAALKRAKKQGKDQAIHAS